MANSMEDVLNTAQAVDSIVKSRGMEKAMEATGWARSTIKKYCAVHECKYFTDPKIARRVPAMPDALYHLSTLDEKQFSALLHKNDGDISGFQNKQVVAAVQAIKYGNNPPRRNPSKGAKAVVKRLKRFMRESKAEVTVVAELAGVSPDCIRSYLRNQKAPRKERMELLTKFLDDMESSSKRKKVEKTKTFTVASARGNGAEKPKRTAVQLPTLWSVNDICKMHPLTEDDINTLVKDGVLSIVAFSGLGKPLFSDSAVNQVMSNRAHTFRVEDLKLFLESLPS